MNNSLIFKLPGGQGRILSISLMAFIIILLTACTADITYSVAIDDQVNTAGTEFAVSDLNERLVEQKHIIGREKADIKIRIILENDKLKSQEYTIIRKGKEILISGGDYIGAMYGILDLAEQVSFSVDLKKVREISKSPFIEKRGIKMNIPLDARLPSYDDTGDAAQKNILEMWNMDFWHDYLDELARNRYNVLSLWSKHPYPSLIKLEDYPEAAMDDVYIYKGEINSKLEKDWSSVDIFNTDNLKLVKEITIDEKIKFWQEVMEYGHDRGIEFFIFSWNIFFSNADNIYGFTAESEEGLEFMRKCAKQIAATYPYLTGMGVTAGERMDMTVGKYTNVQWLWESYGKGIASIIEEDPDREFRFIFRRHHTFLKDIDADFTPHFPGRVETSFKYSLAHMYTTTSPPLFDKDYHQDVVDYDYKCWMNLRNDDIFNFRWGDPDYVRDYLVKMAEYPIAGFYIGSDGYLWGREFTSKNPFLSGELEVKKHWYREMLWGRLAYDPGLDEDFFQNRINYHFPDAGATDLYPAWQNASKIIPMVTNFHWQPLDNMWAVEGCMDYSGFHNVRNFINSYTFETDKILDIPAYVRKHLKGEPVQLITPFEISDSLEFFAGETMKLLETIRSSNHDPGEELKATLNDNECMALLGYYYARKINGATYLHLHECVNEGDTKQGYLKSAMESLVEAAEYWKKYAKLADSQYKSQLLARTKTMDWIATIEDVEKDILIAENSTGQEPKIAKIFYGGWLDIPEDLKKKLADNLEEKGYKVKVIPWWMLEGHASGLRIMTAKYGDLTHALFENAGGQLPEDFEDKGWGIAELRGGIWLIGADGDQTSQALNTLIDKIHNEEIGLHHSFD